MMTEGKKLAVCGLVAASLQATSMVMAYMGVASSVWGVVGAMACGVMIGGNAWILVR